jgi:hypothetical protein
MSKAIVTRLFIGSGIALVAGAALAVAAIWLAIANDVFVMAGPDIVGVHGSALAWSLLGLGLVGGVAVAGAFIGGIASWVGALLNTWRLESRAWFAVLLLLGVFNLGFFAMVAYLVAGPDGTTSTASPTPGTSTAPAGA